MYLLGKRADTINEEDIKRLVQNKIQENKSLDYKRELKLSQDKDKKEFLFDVTSMSNTEGGCLIYGIEESKDERGQNTGTPENITGIIYENFDKLVQQIEDIIQGNTDPSIANIIIETISVENKNVLIIGISKTLGLPIMVTFNDTNKFYRRKNSGKYSVDVYELNQMFMQNQVLKESAERFVKERIEKIRALKVFPNLRLTSSFFIHIIPFSFQNESVLDLTNVEQTGITKFMRPMFLSGYDTMYNADGYATWSGMQLPQIISYDQLIRTGIYEVYTSGLFTKHKTMNGSQILCMDGDQFISSVIEKINNALNVLKLFKIDPPFIISMSMFGMQGGVIYRTHRWGRPFQIDELYLPRVIIPTYESNIYVTLKPTFDIIWQAVAENESPSYTPPDKR